MGSGSSGSARPLSQVAASALLLASLSLVAEPARAAPCSLKQMEIPVRVVDSRPIATLTLNGSSVPMLVDSGAFFSMLSASTAAQLKLELRNLPYGFEIEGYTGKIEASLTRVEKVGLARDAEMPNVEFLVGGNELGAGIMGVLGRNILSVADTEYDLAHGVVRLNFPKGGCDKTNFAYWAGDAPVVVAPLDRNHNRSDTAIRTDVSINGRRTVALLDTGATRTVLTLDAARSAGMKKRDLTPVGRVGGAGKGWVKSWTGHVAMFELGGEKISNSQLQIDNVEDKDYGILVGLDYFLSHRIYVSRLQRRVYVTWNGGPVFAQVSGTAGEYEARYAALPQNVPKDDADALARRGAAAIAAKNYPRALEDLNRACELAPGMAAYFYTRARLHLAMGQSGPALADLDEALRLDPTLAEARFRRAKVRVGLGGSPEALADLAQLDTALPPAAPLRADMAELYASLHRTSEALRQFDLWVSTHQNDARLASILNSRCWMRARLNIDLPLALADCKESVKKDGQEASSRDSLGWTYMRLGDAAQAKKAFDGAIELKEMPFSLYGRGLAQLRLNEMTSGERDLAAARMLKPLIDEEVRKAGFEFAEGAERPKAAGS